MQQLRQLQENILAQLDGYAREDAMAWKQIDNGMATQYGNNAGGSKVFFLGKGGH